MRGADALGKALRARLSDVLSVVGETSISEIRKGDGLKSGVLSDPLFSVEICSGDSFRVSAPPVDICTAILRDYCYGYDRVQNQWKSTSLLGLQGQVAWAIVSAYYCSFFCAIEALRICGNHTLSLTDSEVGEVFENLGGPHADQIRKKRNFKGIISSDFSEIGYTSTGDKPHQAAWRQLGQQVLPIVSPTSSAWVDILKFSNMCAGKNGWEFPSDIRNRWNYRDSTYFGGLGSKSSNPFLKLISDEGAASSWIKAQVSVRSENDSAASLGALARLLYLSMCDTYNFGFLSSKSISGG